MSSVDDIITRAWVQIAPYSGAKLRLTDMLTLFNIMEDLTRCKILSEEYREFLVEFILECPDTEVDHNQFKSLIERLFESSFENIIRGNLMARTREGYENTNNYDQDFTQTMNLESSKFNEFMQRDSIDEKEDILRKRISELESMISKSQIRGPKDDRVTSKMKDILIGYYKSLDSISRVSYISGDMTNIEEWYR
ncbi:hypothetical protein C6P40_002020 [Pichia californica]|uniref:Uncharacterized protein n=1 Tax=Pichia californica TaxID=460514 RepID=A0A9P6WP34_9ASCO|nr:hypothetical protein C6P42_004839 [[Candida] californica]KAG0690657.1 hypothetical protein C6P40_002020 [[Candida] californica]